MKVSIITVVKNNEKFISDCIESVLMQDYPHIEYILVDGGSSDGTLKIIDSYRSKIQQTISEPDDGIYFAMNKGIKLAQGELIGFLNADDFYTHHQVISRVVQLVEEKNCDSVYADLYYVDRMDISKIHRVWKSGTYQRKKFEWGWMPPHPTFFVKRSFFEKYGNFNTDLNISADYELMLRFLYKNRLSAGYLKDFIVKMRTGGHSNRNLLRRIRSHQEDREAWKWNDLKPNYFTLIFKILRKIIQFF